MQRVFLGGAALTALLAIAIPVRAQAPAAPAAPTAPTEQQAAPAPPQAATPEQAAPAKKESPAATAHRANRPQGARAEIRTGHPYGAHHAWRARYSRHYRAYGAHGWYAPYRSAGYGWYPHYRAYRSYGYSYRPYRWHADYGWHRWCPS
jgi:hypothetical protein